MIHGAETPDTLQDDESDKAGAADRWIALIGPNEASRRVIARALAGSGPVCVREFVAYPPQLSDVPRFLDKSCSLVMIDVDSDESYALALVQKIVATSSSIVMVYSRRSESELIMRCMQAGARDFLPIPPEEEPAPAAETTVPAPAVAAPEPPAAKPAPEPAVAAVPEPAPPAEPQTEVEEAKPAAAPLTLPEWEVPVVPVFRPVGAAPPPEQRRRILKWLLVLVILAAAAGLALVFLQPLRQFAAHGIALPASRADGPARTSSPAVEGSAPAPSGLPSTSAQATPAAVQPAIPPAPGSPRPAVPGTFRGASVDPGAMNAQLTAPARISGDLKKPVPKDEPAAGFTPAGIEGGSGSNLPGAAFARKSGIHVMAPVSSISAGVATGMLIRKTEPVYPRFARETRVSGTVVLGATISKSGAIENLHVISGPASLATAALDAVRTWRYRPYLLDGQPVEVQTTINVVFNLDK